MNCHRYEFRIKKFTGNIRSMKNGGPLKMALGGDIRNGCTKSLDPLGMICDLRHEAEILVDASCLQEWGVCLEGK